MITHKQSAVGLGISATPHATDIIDLECLQNYIFCGATLEAWVWGLTGISLILIIFLNVIKSFKELQKL